MAQPVNARMPNPEPTFFDPFPYAGPLYVAFIFIVLEYAGIVRDAWRARPWRDKIAYVLRGPGWTPARPV